MYATSRYLFALKCKSCRVDSNDIKDLIFLVDSLKVKDHKQASEIIEEFFDSKTFSVLYKDILDDIWSGTAQYYL